MNYKKIYDNLIKTRSNQTLQLHDYYENHHIVPKCLGGSDDKHNLVKLTFREHYLAHWLLAKHYNNKKLWNAFSMMVVGSNKHTRVKNGREFQRAKIARVLGMTGENNPMYGKESHCKCHTEQTKEKIRQSKLGKKRTPFTRSPATDETKKKISESKKGKVSPIKGRILPKFECIHCNKMVDKSNMARWHGDNCKMK